MEHNPKPLITQIRNGLKKPEFWVCLAIATGLKFYYNDKELSQQHPVKTAVSRPIINQRTLYRENTHYFHNAHNAEQDDSRHSAPDTIFRSVNNHPKPTQ